ncbi:MAG: flippase [Gemmatimonadota bacterium]
MRRPSDLGSGGGRRSLGATDRKPPRLLWVRARLALPIRRVTPPSLAPAASAVASAPTHSVTIYVPTRTSPGPADRLTPAPDASTGQLSAAEHGRDRPPRPSSLRSNVAWMGMILAASTLIPMVTLPHMTRALGAESFGKVVFVQAVMAFAVVFTDYAFSWSGVRDIAGVRGEKAVLSRTFLGIWGAQWVLTLLAGPALMLFAWFHGIGEGDAALYVLGYLGIVIGNTLFPVWFFQGLERMGEIALIQVATRLLSVPAILGLVRSPRDTALALAIQAFVTVLAGALAIAHMRRRGWITWQAPHAVAVIDALRGGSSLFVSKLGISVYTALAPIVLGLTAGTTAVSYFSIADRLRLAGQSLLTPITNALFPRLSHLYAADRAGATRLVARAFAIMLATAASISLGLFVMADVAIRLFGGPAFGAAVPVLRLLAALPLVVGLSNFFGVQVMLTNGRARAFNLILAAAAALGGIAIWPLTRWLGAVGAAVSIVGAECFVTTAMAVYLLRNPRLWRHS